MHFEKLVLGAGEGRQGQEEATSGTGISEGEAVSRRSGLPPTLQPESEPPGWVGKPPTVSKGLGVGRMV